MNPQWAYIIIWYYMSSSKSLQAQVHWCWHRVESCCKAPTVVMPRKANAPATQTGIQQMFDGQKRKCYWFIPLKTWDPWLESFWSGDICTLMNKIQVWLWDDYHLHSLKGTLSKPGDPDVVVEDNIKLGGWATEVNTIRHYCISTFKTHETQPKPNHNPQKEHQQHHWKPSHWSFWTGPKLGSAHVALPTVTCANRAPVAVDANGKVNAT